MCENACRYESCGNCTGDRVTLLRTSSCAVRGFDPACVVRLSDSLYRVLVNRRTLCRMMLGARVHQDASAMSTLPQLGALFGVMSTLLAPESTTSRARIAKRFSANGATPAGRAETSSRSS